MKAIRIGKISLIATAALLLAAAPTAQDGGQPRGGRPQPQQKPESREQAASELKMIALAHARAQHLAETLSPVVGDARIIADERTNSLIVAGSPQALSRVSNLVAQLDVPGIEPKPGMVQRFYRLDSPVRDNGLAMLQKMAPSSRFAADGRLLVTHGPPHDLSVIEELVEQLKASQSPAGLGEDLRPRAITANFFFIETRMDGGEAQNAVSLPDALKPVATTLEQNGFHNASLLAPLMVNLVESPGGNEFHLEGSAGSEGAIDVDLSGTVRSAPASERVDLRVRAQLMERVEVQTGQSVQGRVTTATMNRKVFTIETRLEVKLGDYVILAATPSSTGDGRAIALAVRATAGE